MKENKENKKNKKKMVSLVIAAKDYKILHKTLEPIVGECGLEFNKSGLSILTQSPCKTMLCDITIDAEVFNDYDLAESFEVEWDLIMAEARGLMKDYNQGLIWIDIFEVDGEKLDVDYLCEMHHDIFKDSFTLHTTKNKPRVPKFDTNCVFEISKETLQKVSERSETLGVVFGDETVWFSNQYEVDNWVTEGMIVSSNETGKALYTSDSMLDIVNSLPDKSNMIFEFASDHPCKLSCEIVKGFTVNWMLAPRLECD